MHIEFQSEWSFILQFILCSFSNDYFNFTYWRFNSSLEFSWLYKSRFYLCVSSFITHGLSS